MAPSEQPARNVVIYSDTTSADLRHELPLFIRDPLLYVESGGNRHVVASVLEAAALGELDGVEVHALEEFGVEELVAQGLPSYEVLQEVSVRAVQALGVGTATVPVDFPLALADRLRDAGIGLVVDREFFVRRRRVKSECEVAGIRRAQRAAEAAMDAARVILRSARDENQTVATDQLKAAINRVFVECNCTADEAIVSHGPQSAIGHHRGAGLIAPGDLVLIDVAPRDLASGCYADMSRTFVIGEPNEEIMRWHGLAKDVLEHTIANAQVGVGGRALFDTACEIFERSGFQTQRTKVRGKPLESGFTHALGHGVGLAVHEEPHLGMTARRELVAGDVIAIEPGLYRKGFGGLRLEDVVLVTDRGPENLSSHPYDLEP